MPRLFAFLLAWIIIAGLGLINAKAQAPAATAASTQEPAKLSAEDLDKLVGPIALYSDELIGIVLPASTYPIQIVQAARFLERLKKDPKLKPRKDWDTSVIGLLNYPEVIKLMNDDLDWTWKLGEAVAAQQSDVLEAVQQFRSRVQAAGNLKTDKQQVVEVKDQTIIIKSSNPEVIYVPQYDPAVVVVSQPVPVPYYYSAPYPVYTAPAAAFWTGMFVGAAVSYGLGWGRYGYKNSYNINVNRPGRPPGNWRPPAGHRPGRPGAGRPGAGRPGVGRPGAGRPGAGRPGARPGQRPGSRPGQRPGSRPAKRPSSRPAQRPSSRPAKRPSSRPAQRPSRARNNRSAFQGYGRGSRQRSHSNRGRSSRSSSQRSRGSGRGGRGGRRGGGRRR